MILAGRSSRANITQSQTAHAALLNGKRLQLLRLDLFPSNAMAIAKQSCTLGASLAILLSCIPPADAGAVQNFESLQTNTFNGMSLEQLTLMRQPLFVVHETT